MTPLEWLDSLQGSGIRPGLGRMRSLLRALRDPHRAVPAVVVAGTNGKGSTSALLTSILTASGYRCAHYTSPHLVELRERWTVDGRMISEDQLVAAVVRLQQGALRAGIVPTYFEALTLVAFDLFAHERCDLSVLEVGMGGRLDATNVVRPMASVITPIGFDHMEYLGTTIRRIAREKAGIIHRGSIALTSNHDETVLAVLRRRAAGFGTSLIVVDEKDAEGLVSPLAGEFQVLNTALAVRTARELAPRLPKISAASIARGVASTRWRGRLERFAAEGREIWVDGCHNAHAAEAVAPFVDRNLPRPRLLVLGIMGDKEVEQVVRRLVPLFDRVVTTEPYPPRSEPAGALAERVRSLGVPATAVPDPAEALREALASGEASVFIGGSLYLAGAAIAFFDKLAARQEQPT